MIIHCLVNKSFITVNHVNKINGTLQYHTHAIPVIMIIIVLNATNVRIVHNVMLD